jgi:hypothetical protein
MFNEMLIRCGKCDRVVRLKVFVIIMEIVNIKI